MICQYCGEIPAMEFEGDDGNPVEARVNCPNCYGYLTGCFLPMTWEDYRKNKLIDEGEALK